jgi:hypothetical protein
MHCVGLFTMWMTLKKVDIKMLQTMRCLFCYNNPILITNAKTQARRGLILYNTTNGTITLKKHVFTNHSSIAMI